LRRHASGKPANRTSSAALGRAFEPLLRLLEAHAARARADDSAMNAGAAANGADDAANGIGDAASRAGDAARRAGDAANGAGDAASGTGESRPRTRPPTIALLGARFGLTAFEEDVLVLCAGVELDGRFRAACSAANGNGAMPFATFGLALNALPHGDWRAISASSALRYWRLVEAGPGPSLVESPLRIDDAILQCVLGYAVVDNRIAELMRSVPAVSLSESQQLVVRELAALWLGARTPPFVQLLGSEPAAARAVAAAACALVGVPLHALSFPALLARGSDVERDVRLIVRQTLIDGGALLIDEGAVGVLEPNARALLERLIDRASGAIFLTAREPLAARTHPASIFTIRKPTSREQREYWIRQVGENYGALAGRLATQFDFDASRIELAAHNAAASTLVSPTPAADFEAAVWSSARRMSRARIEGLAQLVEPHIPWDALVLPAEQRATLELIIDQVRGRATVYDDWGFGALDGRGLGITALFAGPSGTGKTMAAEVIAHRLEVDLYRVDLSATVSKYIGETEKNLRRIFDAAEEGGAILLFDEADALFGKRSEVKDSHDRHANVEISYLLQRMETYRGVAILTTNVKDVLDRAFLRRIRFVVSFPFPDAAHREAIWRGAFPPEAPRGDLDYRRLAQLDVAGANIKNIALNAAFAAAAGGGAVTMEHLLCAARIEYAKIERTLGPSEVAGWFPGRNGSSEVLRR
jgi:hypothetical protein